MPGCPSATLNLRTRLSSWTHPYDEFTRTADRLCRIGEANKELQHYDGAEVLMDSKQLSTLRIPI